MNRWRWLVSLKRLDAAVAGLPGRDRARLSRRWSGGTIGEGFAVSHRNIGGKVRILAGPGRTCYNACRTVFHKK